MVAQSLVSMSVTAVQLHPCQVFTCTKRKWWRPDRQHNVACRATANYPFSWEQRSEQCAAHPDWLPFQHAAEAMDEGRFTEAATICEEALQPHLGTSRLALPPTWSVLRLQMNFVEALLHAKQYSRVIHAARWLRRVLPQRMWAKLYWLEGIAHARLGNRDDALQACIVAFTQGTVPEEYREAMRLSFAIACASGNTPNHSDDSDFPAVPCPVDCYSVPAADTAYPFLTVDDQQEHMFVPQDVATDSACSLHPEWHQGTAATAAGVHVESMTGDDVTEGSSEGVGWTRDMLVKFMLFGNPFAMPVTRE